MTFKTIAQAVAISAVATLGTSVAVSAATCDISMPASGGNARVASVNANIVNVLQTQYPGVEFTAPSATQSSSVSVPGCVGADFSSTGANVSNVGGGLPAGAGNVNAAYAAGGAAALLALVLILNDDDSNGTTTTTN